MEFGIWGGTTPLERQAVAEAKRLNPRTDPSIFDFIGDTLLQRDESNGHARQERLKFIARFQQTTGPVMAKGTEDTAFYRYTRFVALNEVGGTPDRFGADVPEFHRAATARDHAAGASARLQHGVVLARAESLLAFPVPQLGDPASR